MITLSMSDKFMPQEVSRDFKNTLEREIGLDEVASSSSNYKSTQYMNNTQQAVADPSEYLSLLKWEYVVFI